MTPHAVSAFGHDGWQWLNPPPRWTVDDDGMTMTAGAGTDFWRRTHYGFVHDDGHLLASRITGDFSITAAFAADYRDQYDQAGLMIRIDERNWMKIGVELDGGHLLSAVVTREVSDWSVMPLSGQDAEWMRIEMVRTGDTVVARYGLAGQHPETLLRLAYLPPGGEVLAGPMCAAPKGGGFEVRFAELHLEPH